MKDLLLLKRITLFSLLIIVGVLFKSCIEDVPPFLDPFVDSSNGPTTPNPDLKYNEIFRKACHNCYEKQYASSLGEALNFTNNIEIDFWESKDGASGRKDGAWYVRHDVITLNTSGNDNCCTGGPNGSNDLDACLRNVNDWSEAHPNHEVITVFIDKKDAWSGVSTNRHPAGLDSVILEIFGDKIYTPTMLQGIYSSPRTAIANNAWPTLNALRGKVIIAITGPNQYLNKYVVERQSEGLIFVVPKINDPNDVTNPSNYASNNIDYVVFYNMDAGNNGVAAGSAVRALGAVGRTWGMPENDNSYIRLINNDLHIMALYKFKEESFNGGVMEGPF